MTDDERFERDLDEALDNLTEDELIQKFIEATNDDDHEEWYEDSDNYDENSDPDDPDEDDFY